MKVYAQKGRSMTQGEIHELAGLLVKAGYTVKIGRAKVGEKVVQAVEFTGDGADNESGNNPI